jgi:hypothetical protein
MRAFTSMLPSRLIVMRARPSWCRADFALLAFALLIASPISFAHAQRGPAFNEIGTIVVVPNRRAQNPPTIYLENQSGRVVVFCAPAFQYRGKAVRVEGTKEGSGICADRVTEIDPALLPPAQPTRPATPPGARPRAFAEYCRFVTSPPGTFLCTPAMSSAQDSIYFVEAWAVGASLDHGRADLPQYLVDVNGDGKLDYCRFVAGPAPALSCAVRSDTGFTDGAISTPPGFDLGYADKPRFLADVDGDGRPDYCRFIGSAPNVLLSCALQRDGGYGGPALNSGTPFDAGHADKPAFMVDVNGDGKADYCRFVGPADAPMLSCTLATAEGFAGDVNSASGVDLGHAEMGRFMADVNGDGNADFCRFIGAQPMTQLSCLLSDGQAFGRTTHQSQPLLPEAPFAATQGVNPGIAGGPRFLIDVDADGMADYCRVVTRPLNPHPFFSCAFATRRGFGNYDVSGDIELGLGDKPRLLGAVR